nr:hypothetical protein [uncultured Rhodopila sp.]
MSRHLLIAGTGRAGTSFLVRYLARLGLDTHLARDVSESGWDATANAGLEDTPLPDGGELPYVIKSPWTYQVIHQALKAGALQFDAAVIPMRDLTEAAGSRCIIEMQAMHRALPWMSELEQTWEHFGHTPGGIVYSNSPVDQGRLLAVGLHQLLEHLVRAEVPVVFLSFPRLIEDADYLYRMLAPVLPHPVDAETALAAHAALADPSKVRVGAELRPATDGAEPGFVLHGPGPLRLERAALTRTLADVRLELADVRNQLAAALAAAQEAQAAARDNDERRLAAEQAAAAATLDRDRESRQLQTANQALAAITEERAFRQSIWQVAEQAFAEATAGSHRLAEQLEAAERALAAVTLERDGLRVALHARSSLRARLRARAAAFLTSADSATGRRLKQWLGRSPRVRSFARRVLGA